MRRRLLDVGAAGGTANDDRGRGDSNLGPFLSGRKLALDPTRWLGDDGARAVARLETLSVRDGVVALRLRDRWMVP